MGYVQAAAGVAGLAYGVIQGERGSQAQKRGLRLQAEAQRTAEEQALRQERRAEQDLAREMRKSPDIGAILAGESLYGGGSSALLTGNRGRPRLGRSGALGA